jgi:hypothetical protein
MPALELFTGILNPRGTSVKIVAPTSFKPALGPGHAQLRDGVHMGSLSVSGTWHGLQIVQIERHYRDDEQMLVDSFFISFREPIGKVRKVLNALGFGLSREGHSSPEGNGRYYNINLFRQDGLTTLNCQ